VEEEKEVEEEEEEEAAASCPSGRRLINIFNHWTAINLLKYKRSRNRTHESYNDLTTAMSIICVNIFCKGA
jgi:hypothetical protein